MILLAIETSHRPGSLAVYSDGELLAESLIETAGRRQAQSIVVVAQELLAEQKMKFSDVNAVACSNGPGSFTGLRVGLTFAKSLAFANQCPLVAVPTLAVLANQLPDEAKCCAAVIDAQRGDVFLQKFEREDSVRRETGVIEIVNAGEWVADAPGDLWLIGPGTAVFEGDQRQRFSLASPEKNMPTATVVGQLGLLRIDRGESDDAVGIEPLYVRRSAAEEKANQKNS
ncbi:tRNA (adenosine(37)-N6)-threonylcarbamoyltransferase complex dimerization subunit type 1 TsaB [Calycomorphotria hydatis]|uniref:tRNA threonylcarbamoyladenosine biosynthesis protein TsaB n=1 Tax=Calycomorphotria hydatis TaxID=2528027 RepID=A0A517T791_9PLAN|nr:tRNA (adenosine(37)-N6)-threonylcarbamoyltransferase complex dimerization subunit type 1 TsaB [Calycomorphotria hydatis]QDT64246.1 tRNA threonylcarbamoyladenosine biosynthesis protein TsaB [Calycomorphotria hydatis]